jgi:hypothetical protein
MLYKVTPMMVPEPAKTPKPEGGQPRGPRKRRKSAVYDADGNEVLVSLTCLKCRALKPLAQFGLRKMGDGAIRNQPWCRGCRGAAGTKGKKGEVVVPASPAEPVVKVGENAPVPVAAEAAQLAVTPVEIAPAQVATVEVVSATANQESGATSEAQAAAFAQAQALLAAEPVAQWPVSGEVAAVDGSTGAQAGEEPQQ